jgi:sugar phosphate permease
MATQPGSTLSVAKFPVFYGWVVMAVGTLGLVASSPGQTYAISIFLEPLLKEFDLTRTTFASLYMVATLTGSLLLPQVGVAVDRYGCRKALTLVSLALAGALVFASQMSALWMLALALVLLRFLGQGSMTLVSTTMINQWWMSKRGRIMGLVGLLSAVLGTGCFPPVIHYLIEEWGWRGSFLWEAAFMAVVMAPIAFFLARHRPEEHGLATDGEIVPEQVSEHVEIEGMTKAEAQRTLIFWVATLGIGLQAMLVTGLHFHAVALFQDKGLSAATAAATYLPIATTASLVTFVSGWWVERLSVVKLLSLSLVCLSAALLAATKLVVLVPVLGYAVLLGFTGGLFRTVSGVIWSQLFGRKALGAITGAATTFMVAGSAFGPLPMGWARDRYGSFDGVLSVLAILPAVLAVVTLLLEKRAAQR